MISRRDFLKLSGAGVLSLYAATRGKFTLKAQAAIPGGTLDPVALPKIRSPRCSSHRSCQKQGRSI